jgi:predicted cobalt transporter CbtA
VWKLVGLMLLGLIPAGLGALALSPLAVTRAAGIAADPQADPRERRSAWLALVAGTGVGLLGALLALVLLLHIIG